MRHAAITAITLLFLSSPAVGDAMALPSQQSPHSTRNCTRFHSGHPVGDGEFSDGALISATHLSCKRALDIVKPKYPKIVQDEHSSSSDTGQFNLGAFSCEWNLEAPAFAAYTKTCVAGRRSFKFL